MLSSSMQLLAAIFFLAGAHASAPVLKPEPSENVGPLPHLHPPEETEALALLQQGDLDENTPAFGRATLYRLGYANAVRSYLEAGLQHWETEGEPLAFLLPPVADIQAFNVAHVQERYDIPLEMRPLVASYVQLFQGNGRKWFVRWLGRSTRYAPLMRPLLEKAQLPKDTVYLAMIESGFSPHAYSWAHAAGPWQFIPTTGAYYGLQQNFWVDERKDPLKSTLAAARYLTELYRKTGDWYLTWASYNAGETRVRRLMERHAATDFWELSEASNLAQETKHYVPKLIAAALIAKHPEAFGFEREEIAYQPLFEFDEVLLETAADLNVIARLTNSSVETLQELNPELLHCYTPPASNLNPYALRIPKGSKEAFTQTFAPLSTQQKSNAQPYVVRKGDSFGKIAAKAKIHPEVLAQFNGLPPNTPLRVGQTLALPKVELLSNPLQNNSFAQLQGKRPRTYRVVRGDSLWSIARKFDVKLENLADWNKMLLRKNKTLLPGVQLNVWPGAPAPAKAAKPKPARASSLPLSANTPVGLN